MIYDPLLFAEEKKKEEEKEEARHNTTTAITIVPNMERNRSGATFLMHLFFARGLVIFLLLFPLCLIADADTSKFWISLHKAKGNM
jgi:hypothetical protein